MRVTISEFFEEMRKFSNIKNSEQRDEWEKLCDIYTVDYERQRGKYNAFKCLCNGEVYVPTALESGIMFYLLKNASEELQSVAMFSTSMKAKNISVIRTMLNLYADIREKDGYFYITFDVPPTEFEEFKQVSEYILKQVEKFRKNLIENSRMFSREATLKNLIRQVEAVEKEYSDDEVE